MGGAMAKRALFLVGLALLAGASCPPRVAADSAALAAAKKCRKTISIQGRTYAKKRLGYLLGCVDKLLKCELLREIEDINPNSCRSSATDSCTAKIGPSADSSLSKAAAKFDDKAALACLLMPYADVLSNAAGGLWYAN